MMRQYLAIKREVPAGAIVMFRLGDFYEMFGEDAIVASPVLGATLTHRGDQPMCGVPYHAVNSYLAKLIRAGMTAALCDQVEDPKTAKGLVRREVTRIVTPGTVTEDGILDETVGNYIAAVDSLSLALLDLPTGEFLVEEFPNEEKLAEALERYSPAELVVSSDLDPAAFPGATRVDAWTFSVDAATECLSRQFAVLSLDGFGLAGRPAPVSAAGALVHYVGTTLRHPLGHVRSIRLVEPGDGMTLDAGTIRHLQLLPYGDVPRSATLLGVLDVTKTPMGARTLRSWIARPLARASDINARLDCVETYVRDRALLLKSRSLLSGVRDIERLVQKAGARRAGPRDLKALADSLRPVPEIKVLNAAAPQSAALVPEQALVDFLDRAIAPDPPALVADGGFIAPGFDAELDELRGLSADGHQRLAEFQAREQARTGIAKLRVKHVSTFGFVIEVPKSFASQVPQEYERRQTLTTGERYTTPELKEYERKVLGAQERAVAIEQRLYGEILDRVGTRIDGIQRTAAAIGELDAVMSLADRALAAGYVRPVVDDSDALDIEDGRHPIIEQLPDAEPFVPNSAHMNCTTDQIILITGPNMAGKSTYIRQVATIAVMAQMGGFVPAASMRLGVIDRVFTRIGAGDDLSRGRSTFLVEMQETANILHNATPRSLIVLDEIGRGTSTFDGISIAWAVAEYLHDEPRVKARTLFATHYHELTDLALSKPGVANCSVLVRERGDGIVFLRRIVDGPADRSYGIAVAKLAGMPEPVLARARQILANLEANEISEATGQPAFAASTPRPRRAARPGDDRQMTLF